MAPGVAGAGSRWLVVSATVLEQPAELRCGALARAASERAALAEEASALGAAAGTAPARLHSFSKKSKRTGEHQARGRLRRDKVQLCRACAAPGSPCRGLCPGAGGRARRASLGCSLNLAKAWVYPGKGVGQWAGSAPAALPCSDRVRGLAQGWGGRAERPLPCPRCSSCDGAPGLRRGGAARWAAIT